MSLQMVKNYFPEQNSGIDKNIYILDLAQVNFC